MAVIKSGATSDNLTVDPVSKAARVTVYDADGTISHPTHKTYQAAIAATATAAGTGVFFSIAGSGSKTVKVHRISVSGTVATAATHSAVVLTKRTALATGGTATTLTAVPNDSTSAAATATVKYFTALATAGTGGGPIMARTTFFPITATPANAPAYIEFIAQVDTGAETQDLALRGAAESLELTFAATTTNAPTLSVFVTFTEE